MVLVGGQGQARCFQLLDLLSKELKVRTLIDLQNNITRSEGIAQAGKLLAHVYSVSGS